MSDELSRRLADGMAAEARQVTAGHEFTERVIGRALAGAGAGPDWSDGPDWSAGPDWSEGPGGRPPAWQNWILPAVAAVLVAALVGAVLFGTRLLHSSGSSPAGQHPTSPALSQPVQTTGSPTPTPTPSLSGTATFGGPGGGSGGGPAGGPVPAGFRGYDLTWVSDQDGWALGTAPCGSPPCTSILRTRDGGQSWVGIPAPRAYLIPSDTCASSCAQVSNMRFANSSVGYAYGPDAFYLTTDGGASWHQQAGGYAYGLEVVSGSVFRVIAQAAGCAPGCAFRLQRAAIGSSSWQDVPLPAGGRSAGAQLAASGHTVVLATYANPAGGASDATAVLFSSRDGGASWQRIGEPCQPRGSAEVDSRQVTVAPDGSISVLCVQRGVYAPGQGMSTATSTDGTHFSAGAALPGKPGSNLIGATSAGTLFVLTDQLYRSTDAGRHWSTVAGPTGGYFLGFESSSVGRVSGSNQSGSDDPVGTWTTTDGGSSWTFHSFG